MHFLIAIKHTHAVRAVAAMLGLNEHSIKGKNITLEAESDPDV